MKWKDWKRKLEAGVILIFLFLFFLSSVLIQSPAAGIEEKSTHKLAIKAIWAHPGDMGKNREEVEAFFDRLDQSGVNLVFALVKDTSGAIFWSSKLFSRVIHPDYRDFDLLAAAVEAAHRRGIKIHAWFCDFTEGKNSPAVREHPDDR